MIAIDTNIWVYSFDKAEPAKQVSARNLLDRLDAGEVCVTPWQVISELTNCLRPWGARGYAASY